MIKTERRKIEKKLLEPFRKAAAELNIKPQGDGEVSKVPLDTLDLPSKTSFQFGDLHFNLSDRIVVIEVESAGGVTNLAKYWPARKGPKNKPIFLIHVYRQISSNDYQSHLKLWAFLWDKMRRDPQVQGPSKSNLTACLCTCTKDEPPGQDAVDLFKASLSESITAVKQKFSEQNVRCG
ncbi:MAG: hypothetical protein ACP5O1_09055 [Phycisphaerae bacterium]